jgi:hypothetical protein
MQYKVLIDMIDTKAFLPAAVEILWEDPNCPIDKPISITVTANTLAIYHMDPNWSDVSCDFLPETIAALKVKQAELNIRTGYVNFKMEPSEIERAARLLEINNQL